MVLTPIAKGIRREGGNTFPLNITAVNFHYKLGEKTLGVDG